MCLGRGLKGVGSLSFPLSDKLLVVFICQGQPEGDSEPTVIQPGRELLKASFSCHALPFINHWTAKPPFSRKSALTFWVNCCRQGQ